MHQCLAERSHHSRFYKSTSRDQSHFQNTEFPNNTKQHAKQLQLKKITSYSTICCILGWCVCMNYLLYVPSTKFMFPLNKLVLFFMLQHVSVIYGHHQVHNYTFTFNFFCYFYTLHWRERNMELFSELMPSRSARKHNKLKTKLILKLRIE
jgi:hypothetical protein